MQQSAEEKTKFQPSPAFVQLCRGRRSGRRCWPHPFRGNQCPVSSRLTCFGGFVAFLGSEWPVKQLHLTLLFIWENCEEMQQTRMWLLCSKNIMMIHWHWKETSDLVKKLILMPMICNCHSEHQMRLLSAADHWSADDSRGRGGGMVWGVTRGQILPPDFATILKRAIETLAAKLSEKFWNVPSFLLSAIHIPPPSWVIS